MNNASLEVDADAITGKNHIAHDCMGIRVLHSPDLGEA